MDVARQPPALHLLRLDHLLDEVLVGALAGHQLPVQPRLMHRARDQPADHQQQFDVAVGEFAPLDGVHVEHADQAAGVGLHRHRHHRGEVRAAQRLERHVARVGLLVVNDHDGLAVAGHPAGHALPQRQPDLADLAVERRRRAGQRQRAFGVVEHVHEADVGAGGRGDHPRRRRGERLDAGPAGRGLDQLAQQGQFAVGVDEVADGVRAWRDSLVDAFPQRGRHRAGAVADAELAVDRPQVGLDRLVADHQLGGDALVGQAVDDAATGSRSRAASGPGGRRARTRRAAAGPRCRPRAPPCRGRSRSRRGARTPAAGPVRRC